MRSCVLNVYMSPCGTQVLRNIAVALAWLHNSGLVHCDVRADNVLLHQPHDERAVLSPSTTAKGASSSSSSSSSTPPMPGKTSTSRGRFNKTERQRRNQRGGWGGRGGRGGGAIALASSNNAPPSTA